MPRYFLTKISIEGFRGINNEGDPLVLKFKTDAVNSVFGANGLCKSSTFDAVCYVLHGVVPKLDSMQAAESPTEYYRNRFHTSGEATIQLTFTADDGSGDVEIGVKRAVAGTRTVDSPSGHPKPEEFLSQMAKDLLLLDHQAFLDFIEDSALKRGRSFSSLVGLSKISNMRQALETLSSKRNINADLEINELTTKKDTLERQSHGHLHTIKTLFTNLIGTAMPEPYDRGETVKVVSDALGKISLLQPFFHKADIIGVDFKKIMEAIRLAEKGEEREKLNSILQSILALGTMAAEEGEDKEQDALKTLLTDHEKALQATKGPLLRSLYQQTLAVVQKEEWADPNQCPACDSSLPAPLQKTLQDRLAQYTQVEDLEKKIKAACENDLWVTRLQNLEDSKLLADESDVAQVRKKETFPPAHVTIASFEIAVKRIEELEKKRKTKFEELTKEKDQIEKTLPQSLVTLTEQVAFAQQMQKALNDHGLILKEIIEVDSTLQKRLRWQEFIVQASATFSEAEVALSTAKTTAIEHQYKDMYTKITNNPDIVPVLKRSAGSEELHLALEKFYSLTNLSATTLLPESYRNALAISIFLSAVLNNRTAGRFLILDDITSSFDSGHQFALMELLRTTIAYPMNPNGPQVILLSHDGLLEKYFDKLSNTGGWHHQKLQGLPPHGNVITRTQDANRLRTFAETFLNAGQVDQAKPLVRQYLEYKLLQVIDSLEMLVPVDFAIRDDRKMVENSINVIKTNVELHKNAGIIVLSQQQQDDIIRVHTPAIIGNWITHYSTGSTASLSARVLLGVLDTVDQFAGCFQYTCNCNGSPVQKYYRNLTQKRCGC